MDEASVANGASAAVESALELAVRHGDLPSAIQALERGADPEKIVGSKANDTMRALLTYARHMNKLYPPNVASETLTKLDRALRDGLDNSSRGFWRTSPRKKAENLMHRIRRGRDLPSMWRDATKNDQRDVQRAILLLEADKDPSFRVLQESAVADEAVAQTMKEIPYFSPKRGIPRDFNDKIFFINPPNKRILCRHFVEHRQSIQERNEKLKFDDSHFANERAIRIRISYQAEERYRLLCARAVETHLFNNRDFGKLLVDQFTTMEAGGRSERLMALASTGHAMSVGVRIKDKDGKRQYVVTFFDPNATTSHVRVTSGSLRTFETMALKKFITGNDAYRCHYPEINGISIMFVRATTQEVQVTSNSGQGTAENRMLTSCIKDEDVDATALWHVMARGFAGVA